MATGSYLATGKLRSGDIADAGEVQCFFKHIFNSLYDDSNLAKC